LCLTNLISWAPCWIVVEPTSPTHLCTRFLEHHWRLPTWHCILCKPASCATYTNFNLSRMMLIQGGAHERSEGWFIKIPL
jgi:hypothetical protein